MHHITKVYEQKEKRSFLNNDIDENEWKCDNDDDVTTSQCTTEVEEE